MRVTLNALRAALGLLAGIVVHAGAATAAEPFVLKDGDRVVFLGNSFFERAIHSGHLEAALTLSWPERRITFRNLGWDGDTVYGHSRAGGRRRAVFGDPNEGFAKMAAHINTLDPTVIFVAYGWNESFDDKGGVESFRAGLAKLIRETGDKKRRYVLLSPVPPEGGFGASTEYVVQRNAILKLYRNVIAETAKTNGHPFVDLYTALQKGSDRYTTNGIHPNDGGYRRIAEILARELDLPKPKHALHSAKTDALRKTIVKKNTLYFHRWRPRNDAFVYGERKDEQRIAQTEPEKFEPLVAAQEKNIRKQLEDLK